MIRNLKITKFEILSMEYADNKKHINDQAIEKCGFSFIFYGAGSSANARPVGKNDPPEKILCESFAGFSTVGVQ